MADRRFLLECALAASHAHDDFVFQQRERSKAFWSRILEGGIAEFDWPHSFIVHEAVQPIGAFSLLDRRSLMKARLSAMLLVDRIPELVLPEERSRLRLASSLTATVNADDLYLSRIALDDKFRGFQLGARLLAAAVDIAVQQGKHRLVLEVATSNERARALYEASDFVLLDRVQATCDVTGHVLSYDQMARALT